ncbi:twin-arginine translocase subunit TatC [Brevibacterium gallinarum]|nr:twin-arginine translocase subunit TatC [Brevibacterium gallinarum]
MAKLPRRLPRRQNPEKRMSLGGHLLELRNRVIICLIGLLLGGIVGWILYDPVLEILQTPIRQVAEQDGRDATLNFAGIASPFDLKIKVSLFLGIILTTPLWLYQLWAFIMPGLTKKEKLYALGFLAAAVPLFFIGAALAFFALPNAVRALMTFTPMGASNFVPAQDYFSFVMLIIVVFGIAFVLPVLMVGLNLVGILSADTIRRSWRWIVVLVFAFAAIATPSPDALSMFFLVVPMMLMFFLAWVICLLNDRKRKKRMIAEGTWVDPAELDED